jgi:hypothetical protein
MLASRRGGSDRKDRDSDARVERNPPIAPFRYDSVTARYNPAVRFSVPAVCLAVMLCSGCVATRPASTPTTPPGAAPPDPGGGIDPAREQFESEVRPILEKRCTPCHFPGGKMYDRLPFDKPGTIRVLGTALFTRIHDPGERATISAFLGVPNEGLPEPP